MELHTLALCRDEKLLCMRGSDIIPHWPIKKAKDQQAEEAGERGGPHGCQTVDQQKGSAEYFCL